MKVLIIGAGAIGVAVGASLASVGCKVGFIASKRTKQAIAENGVTRLGIFGEAHADKDDIVVYDDYEIDCEYDYVIVSTKSYSNAEISEKLSEHRSIIAKDGLILIMQNGIGNDLPFLEHFDKQTIYNARVITGFERINPACSKVTVHNAPVLLGSVYGCDLSRLTSLCDMLNKSGIESEICDDVGKALWAKLLYNTTLNPLGAILGASYGELYESKNSRIIMERLVRESYAVMNAAGQSTFQSTAKEYIDELYTKLIPNTYAHRSSTLQDIEKKQKTEIDSLNGSIVNLGRKYDVPTPTHEMICTLIRAIEENY